MRYIGIYVPNGEPHIPNVVPGDDLNRIAEILRGRTAMYPFDEDDPGTLGIWAGEVDPGTNDAPLVVGWKAIIDDAIAGLADA